MITTVLLTMIAATTAQHLGLTEAVAKIIAKVAACPKCTTFWLCVLVLVNGGHDPVTSVGLSLAGAYASFWFGLLLILANDIYNRVWERLQRRLHRSRRRSR